MKVSSTHWTHFASPLQPWLRERATMLRYTYIAFLVFFCGWHSGWCKLVCHCNKATEKACMQVQMDGSHAPCYIPARAQHKEMNQTFLKFWATTDGHSGVKFWAWQSGCWFLTSGRNLHRNHIDTFWNLSLQHLNTGRCLLKCSVHKNLESNLWKDLVR